MAKWNQTLLEYTLNLKRQEIELEKQATNLSEENIYLTIRQLLAMITSLLLPLGVGFMTSGYTAKHVIKKKPSKNELFVNYSFILDMYTNHVFWSLTPSLSEN